MVRHFWFPRANFLIPRENVLPRFARKNNFLPRNQKVCPRESKVCLTIFLPLASIFPCDRNNYSLWKKKSAMSKYPVEIKCSDLRGKLILALWVATFHPDWQLPLIFVWFISNVLCMCFNSMANAHVILKLIKQRSKIVVSQEEKWYPTILRVICLLSVVCSTNWLRNWVA